MANNKMVNILERGRAKRSKIYHLYRRTCKHAEGVHKNFCENYKEERLICRTRKLWLCELIKHRIEIRIFLTCIIAYYINLFHHIIIMAELDKKLSILFSL